MEVVGVAALIAIIWKLVDFLKFLTNKDVNGAITQLSVWLSALAVILLAREADPFSSIEIVGTTFADLDFPSAVLFALGLGSAGSVGYDFKRASDASDSAVTPALLSGDTDR